jgi:glycosyltransferase involved in cell wall biosynthesis
MIMTVLAPLGGIEAALVPLSLELKRQGHEVVVYTLEPIPMPNQNAAALAAAGVEILAESGRLSRLARAAHAKRSELAALLTRVALPFLLPLAVLDAIRRRRTLGRSWQGAAGRWHGLVSRWLDFEALYYQTLGTEFRRRAPDIVHVHGWGCGEDPPGAMAWLRRRSYPVVYTEHNSPDPARHSPMEAAPMNFGDVLIAVSQAGEAGLRQVGRAIPPVMASPYSVTPLPAATEGSHGAFTMTCIARLSPQKGQPVLLEALAQIVLQTPAMQLLLAGIGPTRPDLEAQVTRLGLQKHVTFLGLVSRSELPALLARTDVVVLPSYWEGLPVSLIEALSAGKAIVASRVGGNPELVTHGVNGLLVPPGDGQALAQALLLLAGDPERVRRMGLASQACFAAGGFGPAAVAAQHLVAYRRAIEAHRQPARSAAGCG